MIKDNRAGEEACRLGEDLPAVEEVPADEAQGSGVEEERS